MTTSEGSNHSSNHKAYEECKEKIKSLTVENLFHEKRELLKRIKSVRKDYYFDEIKFKNLVNFIIDITPLEYYTYLRVNILKVIYLS